MRNSSTGAKKFVSNSWSKYFCSCIGWLQDENRIQGLLQFDTVI